MGLRPDSSWAAEDVEGNRIGAVRSEGMMLIRANEDNRRGLLTEELFHVFSDPTKSRDLSR
ncbi:MAG: hypothetical protein ACI855_000946 [Myxococcota bacterium]|jgi:hypothetical protein